MAADHTRSLASRVAPFPVDGYNALTFPPTICGVCCPNVEPGPYSHRAGWSAGAHPAGARSYECPAFGSAGADRPAHRAQGPVLLTGHGRGRAAPALRVPDPERHIDVT